MVEKLHAELPHVLAFFAFPAPGQHRLRTTNLGQGWFKHLRRYLSRFHGCRDADHSEQSLGCFLLAAESAQGGYRRGVAMRRNAPKPVFNRNAGQCLLQLMVDIWRS